MAIRFIDSFSHYATADADEKWSTAGTSFAGITANGGRYEGDCWTGTFGYSNTYSLLGGQAQIFGGHSYKTTGLANSPIIMKATGPASSINLTGSPWTVTPLSLNHVGDGSLYVSMQAYWSSGSPAVYHQSTAYSDPFFLEGGATMHTNRWYCIEACITAFGPLEVEVRVDGYTVYSGTAVDDDGHTLSIPDFTNFQVTWTGSGGGTSSSVCDHRVWDDTGTAPWNTWLGDRKVFCLFARADGTYTDMTPSSGGSHYAMVDDSTPDNDSTYVSDTVVGNRDSYLYDTLSNMTDIIAVQHDISYRKQDAGGRAISSFCRQGGSNYAGSILGLASTDYAYLVQMYQEDPHTSAQWADAAAVNSAEFGQKVET